MRFIWAGVEAQAAPGGLVNLTATLISDICWPITQFTGALKSYIPACPGEAVEQRGGRCQAERAGWLASQPLRAVRMAHNWQSGFLYAYLEEFRLGTEFLTAMAAAYTSPYFGPARARVWSTVGQPLHMHAHGTASQARRFSTQDQVIAALGGRGGLCSHAFLGWQPQSLTMHSMQVPRLLLTP